MRALFANKVLLAKATRFASKAIYSICLLGDGTFPSSSFSLTEHGSLIVELDNSLVPRREPNRGTSLVSFEKGNELLRMIFYGSMLVEFQKTSQEE